MSAGLEAAADGLIFGIANLYNLGMVGIFLSRPFHLRKLENRLGLALVLLAAPLTAAVIANFVTQRPAWTVILPSFLIVFLVVELFLDYLLRLEFRKTALLWPYLALYYAALLGMIGYSFGIGKPYGFMTLAIYFLNLLAAWFSYRRAGHGEKGE